MAERVVPAPDRFATCPFEGRILEYYAGTFEAVYILLHPFIKAVSIATDQFVPTTYPARTSMIKNCMPVSWAEIAKSAELPSIAAVDVGLRTLIHGLRSEFSNQNYADKIRSLAILEHIVPPDEGQFSDLLHDKVLQSIRGLGYEWVWIGDEFCTERKLYWIDDLKGQDSGPTGGHCNVFTPDKALLWTTHWDSHFSFVCSSERNLKGFAETYEGFFCNASTEVCWSVRG